MTDNLNWQTISSGLAEAREQLQDLERRIAEGDPPDQADLKICLRHAYHHINVAWNARHISTERYANLTAKDFADWGTYPTDIEDD
ncbi:MAG: hypothetical protein JXQ27_17145 [Acidobacteria bacterium]|nr:hypothetical protein [Acidobacteriota bacterium]